MRFSSFLDEQHNSSIIYVCVYVCMCMSVCLSIQKIQTENKWTPVIQSVHFSLTSYPIIDVDAALSKVF